MFSDVCTVSYVIDIAVGHNVLHTCTLWIMIQEEFVSWSGYTKSTDVIRCNIRFTILAVIRGHQKLKNGLVT